jgi:hypothetical protein
LRADPIVKGVMLLLAAVSIVRWAIILDKALRVVSLRRETRRLEVLATEKAVTDASVQSIDHRGWPVPSSRPLRRGPCPQPRARHGTRAGNAGLGQELSWRKVLPLSRLLHEQPQVGGLQGVAASG